MRLDHLLSREKKTSREEKKTEKTDGPSGGARPLACESPRSEPSFVPLPRSVRPPGLKTRAHPESRIAREIAERMTLHLFSSSDRIIHSDMYVYLCSFYPDV